jgi:AcrR family transcriptional regulator
MDAVTALAGVSKQTIYSYFPSKGELFADFLDGELGHLRVDVGAPAPITSTAQLRATLLAVATALVRRFMRDDTINLLRVVLGDAYRVPEVRDAVREVIPNQLFGLVEAILGAAAAEGVVQPPQPGLTARMFIGPVVSFVILDGLLVDGPPRLPDAHALGFVVDAFLATLAPAGDRP